MTFATNLIAVGRRLVRNYGESIELQRVAEGVYNPAAGTVATGTTTNYTAYGAPVDFNRDEVDNTSIRKSDVKLWLEKPTTVVPTIGDTATFNSITYRVVNVETLKAQGSDIVYILQCRI